MTTSSACSIESWRIRAHRLPPIAARMLNSWAREALLFNSRPARLTQAMSRSSVTAPATTVSVGAMSPTTRSASATRCTSVPLAGHSVFQCQRRRDGLHFRAGRGDADARLQPANGEQIRARVAALHPAIIRRNLRLEQEVHVRRRHVTKAWRQHADHGERLAVERNRLADRRRVAAELAHPERVADHGGRGGIRARVSIIEEPTPDRLTHRVLERSST